jgi:hypothetical protein
MTKEFILRRILEQQEYILEIENRLKLGKLSQFRANDILRSAKGVLEYFQQLLKSTS